MTTMGVGSATCFQMAQFSVLETKYKFSRSLETYFFVDLCFVCGFLEKKTCGEDPTKYKLSRSSVSFKFNAL